jgi:hypothetical protein
VLGFFRNRQIAAVLFRTPREIHSHQISKFKVSSENCPNGRSGSRRDPVRQE